MIKHTALFCGLILACSQLSSQSIGQKVISSGGTFKSTSAGSLTFTIGETAITTLKKDSSILTQGFEQGTLKRKSSIASIDAGGVSISMYPVPASTFIEFDIQTPGNEKVSITIHDILGNKVCEVGDIQSTGYGTHALHGVSGIPDGVYIAIISVTGESGSPQFFSRRFIINN